MKSDLKILMAMIALAVVSCGTQRKTVNDNKVVDTQKSAPEISVKSQTPAEFVSNDKAEGRLAFGLSLFNAAVANSDEDANVVVSPYSAGAALSMLADGAAGQTKEELVNALRKSSYSGSVPSAGKGYIISSANSAWIRKGFPVNADYRILLEKNYSAKIAERDFSSRATVNEINKWCSDKTAGRIPEIIDQINPDMMMFLINALYFKAPWEYQFDKNDTFDSDFHSPAGDQTVPFMHISREFPCGEIEGCKFVFLPYKSGEYQMAICLPSEEMSISSMLPHVTSSMFESALKQAVTRKVALSMPKFKVNTTAVLNSVLMSLGVEKAFSKGADFSGITSAGIAVDEVKQKCFVEVNEKGAEAAAVTSVGVRVTSVGPVERMFIMNVDRPFVFAIFNTGSNDILFAGRITTVEN
uniref:serpin family protein n=1 Tax=Candidatus Cryptobacteroides bacterium TaxID=3085639 RepID=UPI0040294686